MMYKVMYSVNATAAYYGECVEDAVMYARTHHDDGVVIFADDELIFDSAVDALNYLDLISNTGGFKVCKECGVRLPVVSFYTNAKAKSGLQSYCKKCTTIIRRKYNTHAKGTIDSVQREGSLIKVYTDPELAKFSPRQLMAELKARGYKWDYMIEPQRKVLFEKI